MIAILILSIYFIIFDSYVNAKQYLEILHQLLMIFYISNTNIIIFITYHTKANFLLFSSLFLALS